MSLKQNLEMLLVKYLHKLSPADEEDYNSIRSRRNLMNSSSSLLLFEDILDFNVTDLITSENDSFSSTSSFSSASSFATINPSAQTATTSQEIFDNSVDYITDYSDKINDDKSAKSNRVILGEKSITVLENGRGRYGGVVDKGKKSRNNFSDRKFCEVRKRRVAQLDRFELDGSFEMDAREDFNIRKALNYR